MQYVWVELCIFSSELLSATKQQLFCVTEYDILRPGKDFKPCFITLETTGFSTVIYIKLWWNAKDLQRNQIKL